MPKSHTWMGTSQDPIYLNGLIRGMWLIIEMAGWFHTALCRVRHEMVKLWQYHCLEGRPGVFRGDEELLRESRIDPAWVESVAEEVCNKFRDIWNVVTDNGKSSTGKCVAVFEGRYEPKESGVARKGRDATVQKMLDDGTFSAAKTVLCEQ